MRDRKFLTILFLAAALITPIAQAGAQDVRVRVWLDSWDDDWFDDNQWGPRGWTNNFDVLDRNNDGYLSGREWTGTAQVFARVDRNRDRRLNRAEVNAWERDRRERLADRFRDNDDNRDRRISRREWWGRDLGFERLDVDGDGYLSRREVMERVRTGDRTTDRRFDALDRNDDGRINRAEWNGNRRDFDRLDRNNDGWVSLYEWRRS